MKIIEVTGNGDTGTKYSVPVEQIAYIRDHDGITPTTIHLLHGQRIQTRETAGMIRALMAKAVSI